MTDWNRCDLRGNTGMCTQERERDSWRNAKLSHRGICAWVWHRETKTGGRRKKREMLWYLGSVLGWAPVCGRAAWILSWCRSCRPTLSRCNENRHTLNRHNLLPGGIYIYTWSESATSRGRKWPVEQSLQATPLVDCTYHWTLTCTYPPYQQHDQGHDLCCVCYCK